MMKKYKLLKDLPFAQAGDIFKMMDDDGREVLAPEEWLGYRHKIVIEKLENLDDWFEEIDEYFYISTHGYVLMSNDNGKKLLEDRKSIGNYFETRKEAEKHLEWLKARAVLLGDVKPNDGHKHEYEVYLDLRHGTLHVMESDWTVSSEIRFSSEEDAENSIKNHEKEWKIYLGIEKGKLVIM